MCCIFKLLHFSPKPLQLTAGNESLLIENEDIFKKNGFSFKINESGWYQNISQHE
jgi:hypothetical protein